MNRAQLYPYPDSAVDACNAPARSARASGGPAERLLELERRNSELEAFVQSLAHDSSALVRAIALRADMLAEHLPANDDDAVALLDTITDRARRLSCLCEGLLRLARIGKRALMYDEIDLSKLALEIMTELERETPTRRIYFDVEPGLMARGDPQLVRLVLENLLGNAWKYTASNPLARIEFGLRRSAQGPLHYYVVDNGIGFSPEDATSLFLPFGRASPGASFPGSGLGLTIAKQGVERLGGWIRASGIAGRGAEFAFTLGAFAACANIRDSDGLPPRSVC